MACCTTQIPLIRRILKPSIATVTLKTIMSEARSKRLGRSKLDLYHLKTVDQMVEGRHRSRQLDLAQCWLTVNTSAATGADPGASPPLKWSGEGGADLNVSISQPMALRGVTRR